MKTPRWYPTVVALPGRPPGGTGRTTAVRASWPTSSEVYDPAHQHLDASCPALAQAKPLGLYPHAVLGPNGQVFVVKNGVGQSAYLDVDNQTWTAVGEGPARPGAPAGHVRLRQAAAVRRRQERARTPGSSISMSPTRRGARSGRCSSSARSSARSMLPDGRVLAIGGSVDGRRPCQGRADPRDLGSGHREVDGAAQPGRAPHVPLERLAAARRPGPDGRRRACRVSADPTRSSTAPSTSSRRPARRSRAASPSGRRRARSPHRELGARARLEVLMGLRPWPTASTLRPVGSSCRSRRPGIPANRQPWRCRSRRSSRRPPGHYYAIALDTSRRP